MNEAREGELKPLQHTCEHLFTTFTDPPPEAEHKERCRRRSGQEVWEQQELFLLMLLFVWIFYIHKIITDKLRMQKAYWLITHVV